MQAKVDHMIEQTREQAEGLEANNSECDEMPDVAALVNDVMADDDANDPYLESYQGNLDDSQMNTQ